MKNFQQHASSNRQVLVCKTKKQKSTQQRIKKLTFISIKHKRYPFCEFTKFQEFKNLDLPIFSATQRATKGGREKQSKEEEAGEWGGKASEERKGA